MAENSKIEWTDASFNSHWGCLEVGEGCKLCYARELSNRLSGKHWGLDATYRYFGVEHWIEPIRWHNRAVRTGKRIKVFLNSMGDTFDKRLDPEVRADIWRLIRKTPMLDWQLVTKRIGNVEGMLPPDWTLHGEGYPNVWLIATVVNQEEFDRDWHKLRAIPARIRGLSVEPMLGDLDLRGKENVSGLHWVINGGESEQRGFDPRPMHPDWARFLQHQCARYGIAYFFKQQGAWRVGSDFSRDAKVITFDGRILEGSKEATEAANAISPVKSPTFMRCVGKKKAGRLLDGIEYSEFPVTANEQKELNYGSPV